VGDGPRARAGRDRGGGRVAGVGAAARVTAPVVLGHSFGGGLAKELAYRAPERARRLVLCATWPGPGGTPPRSMAALMLAGQLSATAGWSSLPWLHRVRSRRSSWPVKTTPASRSATAACSPRGCPTRACTS